ncbi:MAG: DNA-3-methyladenine glycosylase [Vicingaceae bacterium]
MKLTKAYYLAQDVTQIAKDLLGKVLVTNFNGKLTSGIITETEAYNGIYDKACHAYGGKRTLRNEVMYAKGGISYVYLCYGIHYLFNVVTNQENIPDAVLIRSISPLEGVDWQKQRRNKQQLDKHFSNGPGKVSQALGINKAHNGLDLTSSKIWIEDQNIKINPEQIMAGKRIGIDYAGEDALLDYRYYIHL